MIARAAKSKKAENILVLDLRKVATFCDYFVICEASSTTRIDAIAKHISEVLRKEGLKIYHIEGAPESKWVLLDCGDVIAHIFHRETRHFYGLERLWGDAPIVSLKEKKAHARHTKRKTKTKKS